MSLLQGGCGKDFWTFPTGLIRKPPGNSELHSPRQECRQTATLPVQEHTGWRGGNREREQLCILGFEPFA